MLYVPCQKLKIAQTDFQTRVFVVNIRLHYELINRT